MTIVLKILFWAILVVFPFGQLLRLELPQLVPAVRLQPLDLAVFVFVIVWLTRKVFSQAKIVRPLFFQEMVLFAVWAGITLFLRVTSLPLNEFLSAFFYLLRLWTYFLFYLALTDFFREQAISIHGYLLAMGVAMASGAIAQYLLWPDTRFLLNFGWDEHYFRAIGTFLDPGFTGILLALSLIALIVDFFEGNKPKQTLVLLGGFLIFLAVGLSFSRVAYLLLVLGLGVTLFFHQRLKMYVVISLLFATVLFLLPKPGGEGVNLLRTSSFLARNANYQQVWTIIKDHFFFGVGYNSYRFSQRDYGFLNQKDWKTTNAGAGADNSFLFVWATTGIFGLFFYCWWWWRVLSCSFLSIGKAKSGLLVFVTVISLLAASTVINCLFYSWIIAWLMIILARFTVDSTKSSQSPSYSAPGQGRQS